MNQANQNVVEIDGEEYPVDAIKASVKPLPKPKRVKAGSIVKLDGSLYVVHVNETHVLLVNIVTGRRWNEGVAREKLAAGGRGGFASFDLSLLLRRCATEHAAVYDSLRSCLDLGNELPRY